MLLILEIENLVSQDMKTRSPKKFPFHFQFFFLLQTGTVTRHNYYKVISEYFRISQ